LAIKFSDSWGGWEAFGLAHSIHEDHTHCFPLFALSASLPLAAKAELKPPAIIGDNMVLQQKQADPIWGWDKPVPGDRQFWGKRRRQTPMPKASGR
jgi:hypothetical protein